MEFNLSQLIILALLIEAIVTTIAWVVDSRFNWQRVTALAISVLLAILAGIDIFAIVGIPLAITYIGPALTGLIIARGANALNDLFAAFKTIGKIPQVFTTLLEPEVEEEQSM